MKLIYLRAKWCDKQKSEILYTALIICSVFYNCIKNYTVTLIIIKLLTGSEWNAKLGSCVLGEDAVGKRGTAACDLNLGVANLRLASCNTNIIITLIYF